MPLSSLATVLGCKSLYQANSTMREARLEIDDNSDVSLINLANENFSVRVAPIPWFV